MPAFTGRAFPGTGADRAELLSGDIEDGRREVSGFAELLASHGANLSVLAEKDPVRVENLHAEVALELAKDAEHLVDRASRALAGLVGGDDQKTPLAQVASPSDGIAVSRPLVEEGIDLRKESRLLPLIE